jgi:Protein of unknown function (DUF3082)
MESEFTPFKNLTGSAIAATFATILHWFTVVIGEKLAAHPIASNNSLAVRISVIVRQVLVTLGTTVSLIFGMIAVGLLLFTLQQIVVRVWQKVRMPE